MKNETVELTGELFKEFLGGSMLVKCHDRNYCGRATSFSVADNKGKKGWQILLGIEFSFIVQVNEVKGKIVPRDWHKYGYCMDFCLPKKGTMVDEKLVVTTDLKEVLVLKRRD